MPKFHMVRSVKGGSGKTAFALRKVVDLTINENKVLYIDADVHASETYSRLFKRFDGAKMEEIVNPETVAGAAYFIDFFYDENNSNRSSNKHYLNSYIHPYRGYYSKLEEIMLTAKLKKVSTVNDIIDSSKKLDLNNIVGNEIRFIFPDPSRRGRAVFGNIFQSSGRSAIGVGAYVAKMKSLLNYVCEGKQFTDVVVDMPPGSDTFSDHLSDIILEMVKEKHDLAIYYVTNDDASHLHSSVSDAITYLHQMRTAYNNEVCLVCNEGRESGNVGKHFNNLEKLTGFLKEVLKEDVDGKEVRKEDVDGKEVRKEDVDGKSDASIECELNRLNYKRFSRDSFYYNCQRENCGTVFSSGVMVEDLPGSTATKSTTSTPANSSSGGDPTTDSSAGSTATNPASGSSSEDSM